MQLAFLVEKIVDIYFKMKYFWLNIFRNLPVPRGFFWNSRSISSEEKGSALRLLFPSPCDFRSFLLAVNTSLQWWNSLSWRIFVPFFSIKYRLTDDCIAFKLSGSYSPFFFDLTDKKNLARYWSSSAAGMSSTALSSLTPCSHSHNIFMSPFVFIFVLLFFISSINLLVSSLETCRNLTSSAASPDAIFVYLFWQFTGGWISRAQYGFLRANRDICSEGK